MLFRSTRGGAYGKTLGGGVAVASERFQRSGQAARNRNGKKEKKKKPKAIPFAMSVFPVLGGPYSKIPLGGFIPIFSKSCGCLKGNSTNS